MTTSIAIEEESGTGTGRSLEHNGYYAGDFWPARREAPVSARSVAEAVSLPIRRFAD